MGVRSSGPGILIRKWQKWESFRVKFNEGFFIPPRSSHSRVTQNDRNEGKSQTKNFSPGAAHYSLHPYFSKLRLLLCQPT